MAFSQRLRQQARVAIVRRGGEPLGGRLAACEPERAVRRGIEQIQFDLAQFRVGVGIANQHLADRRSLLVVQRAEQKALESFPPFVVSIQQRSSSFGSSRRLWARAAWRRPLTLSCPSSPKDPAGSGMR